MNKILMTSTCKIIDICEECLKFVKESLNKNDIYYILSFCRYAIKELETIIVEIERYEFKKAINEADYWINKNNENIKMKIINTNDEKCTITFEGYENKELIGGTTTFSWFENNYIPHFN